MLPAVVPEKAGILQLDIVQTVALGSVSLLLGYALLRLFPVFRRSNIPAPVLGGMAIALLALIVHAGGRKLLSLDVSLQEPLMVAFFTAIGFNASVSLLRRGGFQVLVLLALVTCYIVIQNLVGIGIALLFGLHPLFGVLAGSATLAGGPATGMAFAPLFEQAGVAGAEAVAIASAMAGIVCGGLVGGPTVALLVRRFSLQPRSAQDPLDASTRPCRPVRHGDEAGARQYNALKNLAAILLAMWLGGWVGQAFSALGLTLPIYIGSMLVGSLIRYVDDVTGWVGLSLDTTNLIGGVCLALFLAVAIINLELWSLSGLAAPLLVILAVQVVLVVLFCVGPVFRIMGRDYSSAVMAGGFVAFMLGTTANALTVMQAVTERHGMAPRAFLVVPLVGAFFLDFANALVITIFLNIWD